MSRIKLYIFFQSFTFDSMLGTALSVVPGNFFFNSFSTSLKYPGLKPLWALYFSEIHSVIAASRHSSSLRVQSLRGCLSLALDV
ncbi:hypothetical protein RHMOL_Rhmol12G0174900 [Rhododendron molle]|uniref:Uncharacterized protein n=1 Tax=Rhododendron molle TaxID=49168 RepID=A0ACC0LJA3_RHOML|nr:hypothetical protein RHMOL_Rhmol12G0174900 [Rhododendron molle]